MSLHAAAELVADRIRRAGYVEIVAHHDADGIAAGSILAHAIARAGKRFRLRVRGDIRPGDLAGETAYLLCDIGAGMEDLPKETMVVDHHNPHFSGPYHVNPRIAGVDGDRELSASGAAYLVANNLGDNRDLAGLAMLGIIGDGQDLSGLNLEIFSDGVANGIITVGRGLRLAGRDLPEKLLMAVTPMLDGISGEEAEVTAITGPAGAGGKYGEREILSLCVLAAVRSHNASCVETLYGDTYGLEREVIPDAHSFAAVIDACGKAGYGDLSASLCLRSSRDVGAAWETTRLHRLKVIRAARSLAGKGAGSGIFEVEDSLLASDIADALACHSITAAPVAVISCIGESCMISARSPGGSIPDLGAMIRGLAQACGGYGGGHRNRAGATIPSGQLEKFKNGWNAAVAA